MIGGVNMYEFIFSIIYAFAIVGFISVIKTLNLKGLIEAVKLKEITIRFGDDLNKTNQINSSVRIRKLRK